MLLEAAYNVTAGGPGSYTDTQAERLELKAFDWLLNGIHHVDDIYTHLVNLRDRVMLAAAHVLSRLSYTRLQSITSRFQLEMGSRIKAPEASPQRQELYNLCHGLRLVRLSDSSTENLLASKMFLDRIYPLKYVAPDKKSRLQQAICEMMTSILQPLADESDADQFGVGCDPTVRKDWQAQVSATRIGLLGWSKQAKQVSVAFPAIAMLTCLEPYANLMQALDSLIDQLHKQLKDKRQAPMALLCLTRCYACCLRRCAPKMDVAKLRSWVERGVSPVIQGTVKGTLQGSELQELLRQLIAVVADFLPEYAVNNMVLELLKADTGNWESVMAGLTGLLTILMMIPGKVAGGSPSSSTKALIDLPATAAGLGSEVFSIWMPPLEASRELLEMLRAGLKPLELLDLGPLVPKITASLSKILVHCHQLYGYVSGLNVPAKPMTEGVIIRDRIGALPVFVTAIQCVPFIIPDHWIEGTHIADDLATYVLHAEPSMRQVSTTVLRRCMRATPDLRGPLLASLVTSIIRLQEDFTDVIIEGLHLMLELMKDWLALGPSGAFSSISRVEGAGLGLLCSMQPEVRMLALDMLRNARDVQHMLLTTPTSGSTVWQQEIAPLSFLQEHSEERVPSTIADIIDSVGSSLVQRCYWDFGRWSDIAKKWRPLPEMPRSFDDLLWACKSADDPLRWSRLLCDLSKETWTSCEKSAWSAHLELCAKLRTLTSLDSSGRSVLPHDHKVDLARSYSMVIAAAPRIGKSQVADNTLTTIDFIKLHVNCARSGVDALQQMSILVLGNINPECRALVIQEASQLTDDFMEQRQQQRSIGMPSVPGINRANRLKRDDVRLTQANIYRTLASNIAEASALQQSVFAKLKAFIVESMKHLASTSEVSPELQQLRYCVCAVCCAISAELEQNLRKSLFDQFSLYCADSLPASLYKTELRRNVNSARLRVRDSDSRALEHEMIDSSELLEHAASLAMAAMLAGPIFSPEVRNPQGKVFLWMERLLRGGQENPDTRVSAFGPPKVYIAKLALANLLRTNNDLASTYVDYAYSSSPEVGSCFVQVLARVNSEMQLPLEPHIVVSLVLHKVIDPSSEVRETARSLLQVLSRRVWSRDTQYATAVDNSSEAAVVVGVLADSQISYQMQLSSRLAREHPELGHGLAIEILQRQMNNDSAPEALFSLSPWFEHLNLGAQWEGGWAETLLSTLHNLTAHPSNRRVDAVQLLWATLATNRRNVVPVVDFLIAKGLQEFANRHTAQVPCAVGKQVVLYLSRIAARQTVDHLVYEISQQLAEPDETDKTSHENEAHGVIQEFHHSVPEQASEMPKPLPRVVLPVQQEETPRRGGVLDILWKQQSRANWSGSEPNTPEWGKSVISDGAESSPPKENTRAEAPIAITRSQVALCLLTELACELDEELRIHLPVLLHVAIMNADNPNETVRRECANLLMYLLYTLACKHLEVQGDVNGPVYARISGIITHLQSLHGSPLWQREQATLATPFVSSAAQVRSFVQNVAECFYYDSNLKERWAAEALKWACSANSRHLASRSHQAFCALRPTLNSTSSTAMLAALHKCLKSPNAESLDTAVEILVTLRALLGNLDSSKLILYPQLFSACIALLNSSVVRIGELAIEIMLRFLWDLDLSDFLVQQTILAVLPQENDENYGPNGSSKTGEKRRGWPLASSLFEEGAEADLDILGQGPWMAFQQLLIKGLYQPNTELLALEALAGVAQQIAQAGKGRQLLSREIPLNCPVASYSIMHDLISDSEIFGIEIVFGHVEAGLAMSIGAILPWLVVNLSTATQPAAAFLKSLAEACTAVGWSNMSSAIHSLVGISGVQVDPVQWLPQICSAAAADLFPRYTRLVVQRLIEVLRRGTQNKKRASLTILQAFFNVSEVLVDNANSWFVEESRGLMKLLSPLVAGPLGPDTLALFEAMMKASTDSASLTEEGNDRGEICEDSYSWPVCMDDLGECNKLCAVALARIVEACPGASLLQGRSNSIGEQLLPFLTNTSGE